MKRLGSLLCDNPTGRYLVDFPSQSTKILVYIASTTILLAFVSAAIARTLWGVLLAVLLPTVVGLIGWF